jgi:TatD DNase family protein
VLGGVGLHPTEAAAIVAPQPDSAAGRPDAAEERPGQASGRAALEAAIEEIERLARHPRIGVIGETGLDYHWVQDEAGRAAQAESFRRHIDLAKRLGKVLQIHDRDAHDDVLAVLHSEGAPERTVFHCFSGDAAMARHCADRGWYLSFAGTLTFKNAGGLREALAAVPREQVLVETDAPYLTPMPHRGRPNASYLMPWTVRAMAEVTGAALDEMCITLAANSRRLYGG